MDDLSPFCCQNSHCPDHGRRGGANLSVCDRYGTDHHWRLLYCRTCKARFSERTYGRFGSYFVHTVEEGKPLVVRYRLWLQEGELKAEEIASKGADFTDPPKVTVK